MSWNMGFSYIVFNNPDEKGELYGCSDGGKSICHKHIWTYKNAVLYVKCGMWREVEEEELALLI